MSLINIYKDIPGNECRTIAMSSKSDDLEKIVTNISYNFTYISDILKDFQKYNNTLNEELAVGNFHCKTLKKDMESTYNHIHTEYNKYVYNTSEKMTYYVEFSNNISKQIDSMTISTFYN
jgi:hypothetical protein